MRHVLVYSDSLTWGIIPGTRCRLPFEKRWPGVLELMLKAHGVGDVRVLEDCLNGRRTAWDDPFKPGRNASATLAQTIEMHSPLEAVVLMLGNNDFQSTHQNSATMAALGVAKLLNIIRTAPIEPGMPVPQVVIVAPPPIKEPKGPIASKFEGAAERSVGFAEKLKELAKQQDALFFDAGSVVSGSSVDGIHLDEEDHVTLGKAVASWISGVLRK